MVKTAFVLSFLIIIFLSTAYPQFFSGAGIKGGVTLSNQSWVSNSVDLSERYEFNLGFNASVYGEFFNTKLFNLVSEVGYDRRGYAWTLDRFNQFGEKIGESKLKYYTNYISAAFLGKLKAKLGSVVPYLMAGPRIDFFLSASNNEKDELGVETTPPYLTDFKPVNYGLNLGGGIELNLKTFKLLLDFSYSPALVISYDKDVIIKEYFINFRAGVGFGVKGKKK